MNLSRKLFTLALLLACASLAAAQSTGADSVALRQWKVGFEGNLGVTQASYSDNWTGGEAGSIIWVADSRTTAVRRFTESWLFSNELKLAFGQSHSQNDSSKEWTAPKKSADRIRFDTILRLTRGWAVDPYTAGSLESQFYDPSSALEKRYLNPIELTESIGVARYLLNTPDVRVLTTRVGAGIRQRLTRMDDTVNVGQSVSETMSDGGAEWVTDLVLGSPKTRVSFVSKVTVFQALFNNDAPENDDTWKEPDLNWDNTLRANINSFLQASLAWQLLYDKQIDFGGRLKETLSFGLTYKIANTK